MNKTIILVTKKEEYLDEIFKIIKESNKKVCYLTFNKTPQFILESAEKYDIPKDNFYFIDGITTRIKIPSKIKNSKILMDFDNFGKITNNIREIVDSGYSIFVFDSLSNVLIYPPINDSLLVKFLKPLFKYIEKNNGKVVFVCYENDIRNYSLDKTTELFNRFIKSSRVFGLE